MYLLIIFLENCVLDLLFIPFKISKIGKCRGDVLCTYPLLWLLYFQA